MSKWRKVDHAEFHESFNVRAATLVSSYTNCSDDYAESVFSMSGEKPTHKTVHNNGLNNFPTFYLAE